MKISKIVKALSIAVVVSLSAIGGLKGCALIHHPDPNQGNNDAIPGGPYSLVVIGANNQQIARHITTAKQCPQITLDGQNYQMLERGENNSPNQFEQVTVCQYPLAATTKSVSIQGEQLSVIPTQVNRIAIIGDTGCRMKITTFQNCNNVTGGGEPWPFAQLAEQLAKEDLDVILHMGDFHYRETPCPLLNFGCKGPWGFNWASWQADFFEPAKPLLNKVPWLLTRGNHEDCQRAFKGWFYLLDPNPLADDIWQNCIEYSPTYKVQFNDLTVVQMDSATMPNPFAKTVNPDTKLKYQQMFNDVNELSANTPQAWFVTHRPMWAISSYYDWSAYKNDLAISDKTMQQALAASRLGEFNPSVNLLLSGHIHNFEALSFNVDRPSLMVIGDGGTRLSPVISDELLPKLERLLGQIDVDKQDFYVNDGFAYVIIERQQNQQWLVNFVSIDGKTRKVFRLEGRKLVSVD